MMKVVLTLEQLNVKKKHLTVKTTTERRQNFKKSKLWSLDWMTESLETQKN